MKKLYCVIILLCLVGVGIAEDAPLFLGDDGKPFTGVKKNYPKGEETVYLEHSYVNGIAHGIVKIYEKKTDEKTEKFDIEDYYLLTEMNYIDGKLNGDLKRYWSNGRLQSVTPLKNGKMEGLSLTYDNDGKIIIGTMYRNNKKNGVEKRYMRCNGNDYRVERTMVDNRRQGIERTFINERLFTENIFFDDKLNGTTQSNIGYFISIYEPYADNKLDGEVITIERLGKTKMVTQYKDGTAVGSTYVYKNDKPIMEINIDDDNSAQAFCIAANNTKKLLPKQKSDLVYNLLFAEQAGADSEEYQCHDGYTRQYFKDIVSPFIDVLNLNIIVNICK